MLVNLKELTDAAEKGGYAVGCINTPNLESITAVVEAAEELNMPVILSHAESHDAVAPIAKIGPLMVQAAKDAKVPIAVHLDHGFDEDYILAAIRCGFSSVMADFSYKPFEENVSIVKKWVTACRKLGISVEAEVDEMPSNIEGQGETPSSIPLKDRKIEDFYTKPERAAEFVRQTGVDALTVSFGTVHGIYVEKPHLDMELLDRIRRVVPCALVMHGGSGVEPSQVRQSIKHGIRKINYYTYMSISPAPKIAKFIAESKTAPYYHDIAHLAQETMKEQARYAISLFSQRD